MRTKRKTAAAYLVVAGFVLVLYLAILISISNTDPGPITLEPPWELAPVVVTEAEIRAARDLARYLRTLPGEGNQGRIRVLEWTRGWYNRPISNLDRVALRKLLVGNRFVYRNAVLDPESRLRDHRIHLQHFGENGILRTCEGGHWQRYRYHVVTDMVGAATYVTRYIGIKKEASRMRGPHDNRDESKWWASMLNSENAWYGRPITFDALTGTLAVHSENSDGTWSQYIGHVQTAPFDQPGNACSEGQGAARDLPTIRGSDPASRPVVPLFNQDPSKPLRMGVYFSLYPPPEEGRG